MSKRLLVVPDQHATPEFNNDRADWLSKFTIDLQPDIVVNLGDAADMCSLSSYDKGKRSFHGRSYQADIDAHLDFQSRWWDPIKARKKKLPYRVVLEGNHERRVEHALDLDPQYEGILSFDNYEFDKYYDTVVRYDGGSPGIIEIEGIQFAHFFVTGVSGRPVSGESPARMLIAKFGTSCIQGHTHILDYATRKSPFGRVVHGGVLGCYQDYINGWAGGPIGNQWRGGLAVLDNVEDGNFDFSWVSIESLQKRYA
jgi:hypothetical protein